VTLCTHTRIRIPVMYKSPLLSVVSCVDNIALLSNADRKNEVQEGSVKFPENSTITGICFL
jgi:hypothetical protein